jgi:uncharacterized coiled-coil protein SlyX
MKKNLLPTLVLILSTCMGLLGQTSNKTLNYQAVILDPKAIDIPGASIVGQPLSKGNVCLRFSLLNAQGGLDYEETQSVTTDEYGLVNVSIGAGAQAQVSNSTGVYRSFDSILWNSSVKSLKVSVSYDGCSSFKQVSSQALTYTPYALYAESVEYKNVREAPTKLSQFSNDAGYLIPKDLDPLKNEITFNTGQLAAANQTIADNKKSSDAAFLIVNQSITSLDVKVAENTSSIGTINTKITDQQNQISDTRNQITATNGKLNDQQNQIAATNNSLNSQIGGLQGQINTESSISRAAELSLRNNVAANTASIASNTNEMALKADIDNPKFTGIVAMGTSNPSTSAVLDINSTSQGMLIPRMTTIHRNSIPSPANALLIFNTSNNTFEVYKSSCACWVSLSDGGGSAATNLENNAPSVSTINYKGIYRAGGTANVVYTYSDSENDAEAATTILWEIANDNIGTARTTYGTSASPTFGEAAAGKYVRVKITPRAATGVLNGIDYYGGWTLVDAATVPYGTAVSISGNAVQGSLLTALYTFNGGSGTENTLGSTYTWQTATSNKGANTQTMSIPGGGAIFDKTIRPAINEVNKYIRFGVRAKDNASVTASSFVFSDWVGPVNLATEAAPLATNVSYSPAPGTGVELKASYTYVDANNDPEGTSLYQWYTASDANGANKAAISNATTLNFTPTSTQANNYIGIGVTPKASTGTTTGTEVVYYSTTPSVAAANFTIESVTQSSTNFSINRVMDATDYITLSINVTSPGAIAFSTPTVNGYSFSNGGVYATGAQNVILYAKGTQAAYNANGDNFTITAVGSSPQTRTITIKNAGTGTVLVNNVPTVNNINYKGLYRVGGTANAVYTYADTEKDAEGATSIMWEIATDNQGTAKTTYSTSATPTFVTANAGKYVRVKITPRAATGLLNGLDYYGAWTLIEAASVPYGTNVSLTGNPEQSSLLTGSYTFNGGTGIENTVLGSTFNWQSATSDKGANTITMVIPDGGIAFSKTIKPTITEVNRFIRFGVRARDNASTAATNFAYSDWIGPITLAPETAPTATNVTLSQAPNTNLEINGLYTYNDINNDPEGASVYQWYTATDNQGANKTAISGATSQSFYIDNYKIGSFIGFGVTPKALTGNQTGSEVVYFNPTATTLSVPLASNLSFSGSKLTGLVGNTLTGTYTYTANGSSGTEAGTIQKWYTANNATDAGTLVGTGNTYSPTSADFGKYIIYEVTPVSSTGATGEASRISRYAGTEILGFTSQAVQAAYSLRKLKASYTGNAIRVRRSSDNTTRDIGFTSSGLLDEAAVTNFVTNNGDNLTANGFVSIWYDQSGNGRNVSNATLSEQPIIATSGTVEKYNGLPTVKFVRTSFNRLFLSTNFNDRFYATSAMGVFAYTASTTYLDYDGLLTSTDVDVNTIRTIALYGEKNTTSLNGFGNPTVATATFYRNKVARAITLLENGPIGNLSVVYSEYPTSSVNTENRWIGVQIGRDRTILERNWGGPVSELILFEQNFRESNYVEVLKIQDAQMLYYLGK